MAEHLKKAASGHLLKTPNGHLVKLCTPFEPCPPDWDTTVAGSATNSNIATWFPETEFYDRCSDGCGNFQVRGDNTMCLTQPVYLKARKAKINFPFPPLFNAWSARLYMPYILALEVEYADTSIETYYDAAFNPGSTNNRCLACNVSVYGAHIGNWAGSNPTDFWYPIYRADLPGDIVIPASGFCCGNNIIFLNNNWTGNTMAVSLRWKMVTVPASCTTYPDTYEQASVATRYLYGGPGWSADWEAHAYCYEDGTACTDGLLCAP